jgi:hypothetical protein
LFGAAAEYTSTITVFPQERPTPKALCKGQRF